MYSARTSSLQHPKSPLPLNMSRSATMPHDSHKKRTSNDCTPQRSSGAEKQSPVFEHAPEYTMHHMPRGGSQIPFYDEPNHVAHGWQQMTVLPDVFSLIQGSRVDLPLSPRTRPQTWLVEQQDGDEKAEPSGFNSHPGLRQGPRRPRPLPLPGDGVQKGYEARRKFKPFVDPVAAEQDNADAGPNDNRACTVSWALRSRDVNQKFGNDRSQVPPSKLSPGHNGARRKWYKGFRRSE